MYNGNRLIPLSIWVVERTAPPPPMDHGSRKSAMDERVKNTENTKKRLGNMGYEGGGAYNALLHICYGSVIERDYS